VARLSGRSSAQFRPPRAADTADLLRLLAQGALGAGRPVLSTRRQRQRQHTAAGDQGDDMHRISRPLIELTGSWRLRTRR